jgi:hypothetical protein
MDPGKAALVIIITLVIVVGLNIWIYVSLSQGKKPNSIDIIRKVTINLQQPFTKEDDALKELSQRVAALRKPDQAETQEDPE